MEELSVDNYLNVCRFCLTECENAHAFLGEQYKISQIPILYKDLMDLEMNLSPSYPMSFCNNCIKELETAVKIRKHFKKIEQFWIRFLTTNQIERIQVKLEPDYFVNNVEQMHIVQLDDIRDLKNDKLTVHNISTSEHRSANLITIRKETLENENETTEQSEISKSNRQIIECNNFIKNSIFTSNSTRQQQNITEESSSYCQTDKLTKIKKKCDVCKIKFKKRCEFLEHQTLYHLNDEQNSGKRTNHKHDQRFNYRHICCQYCNQEFIFLNRLFLHHRYKHREQLQIECYRCKQPFKILSRLNDHLRRVHQKEGEDGVFCHVCGVIIKWGNFKRHMNFTHANGKLGRMLRLPDSALQPTKCAYCPETFKVMARLHRHVELIHGSNFKEHLTRYNIQKLTIKRKSGHDKIIFRKIVNYSSYTKSKPRCPVCGLTFDSRDQLNDHSEVHKNYECEICKKKFVGKQNLETHTKQHSKKDRPFTCEVCSAAFTREPHLKNHFQRKHTTDRPFSCEQCDRKYLSRYELSSHMKIVHLKLKPYKCSYCDKTFATGSGKKIHEVVHTGESLFKCEICPTKCLTMTSLESHIGRVHKG